VTCAQYTGVPVPTDRLVSLDDVQAAARRLAGVAVRTPLLEVRGRVRHGDVEAPRSAWLKAESLQPIGSFKIRGAYNALAQLDEAERAAGVVAHSSGNHAQGVARAARLLGIPAVVVMPRDAPAIKVDAVRADGAQIEFVGPADGERIARADELARTHGYALVPSFDDPRIVAGQGTLGLEIVEQLSEAGVDQPAPLTVLVPIGGGGLSSGVCVAVKGLRPGARVVGVEPELAADARDSLRERRIIRWDAERTGRTIADGMRSSALGAVTFAHLDRLLDGVVLVKEAEIARAMLHAATAAHLVVEPSGATALAAWLFHRAELPDAGTAVSVVSGGNVDPSRFRELLAMGADDGD
jgi:threo-3-hydroxy-L-aspartate ammonia-lyase